MLKKILEEIEKAKDIAIFCHENPDGDAIWCLLWLWTLLENKWKNVKFIVPTKVSQIFSFLSWYKKISNTFDYWKYDLLIFADCSELKRIWKIAEWHEDYFVSNNIAIFDHHIRSEINENRLIHNDPQATSCCEVIFESTIWPRKEYFTPEIATYLYLWLTTDSGNFRFDTNHERIFNNALNLVKLWADKDLITDNLINSKSIETINFLKIILERIHVEWDILYSYYDTDDLKKYNVDIEQAWYWLTIIQEIKWPKVVITIRKDENRIKCSLRSKSTNVNTIAKHFWWWGHIHASWFSCESTWEFQDDIKRIIDEIKTLI